MARKSIPSSPPGNSPIPMLSSKPCAHCGEALCSSSSSSSSSQLESTCSSSSFSVSVAGPRCACIREGGRGRLRRPSGNVGACVPESDGCLVAPAVFKTVVGSLSGSRYVRFVPSPPTPNLCAIERLRFAVEMRLVHVAQRDDLCAGNLSHPGNIYLP